MKLFRLGLIINPYAGIGGLLALKGSDGKEIRDKALSMGAEKKANHKASIALEHLLQQQDNIEIVTVAGEMGGDLAAALGYQYQIVYSPASSQTEAEDSEIAAQLMLDHDLDLLLFAGGDGTARNICNVVGHKIPVLGIPAGCKIHSGVYAITPKSAGRVVQMLVKGEIVSLNEAEVKDIDEALFRQGKVQARYYGDMSVPTELRYVQSVKMGGRESDELVLADIAAHVIEQIDDHPDHIFIMGSGSTVDGIMQELDIQNTLLGIDLVKDRQLLASDLIEADLYDIAINSPCKLVLTLIGGQGHIIGRGNQQLSERVIDAIGRENIILVASKSKLQNLAGRPLIVDSGNPSFDSKMSGLIPVITGYKDLVLYSVADLQDEGSQQDNVKQELQI
jgi:predicted polyphosphate/ATP-dependent NAD kinase